MSIYATSSIPAILTAIQAYDRNFLAYAYQVLLKSAVDAQGECPYPNHAHLVQDCPSTSGFVVMTQAILETIDGSIDTYGRHQKVCKACFCPVLYQNQAKTGSPLVVVHTVHGGDCKSYLFGLWAHGIAMLDSADVRTVLGFPPGQANIDTIVAWLLDAWPGKPMGCLNIHRLGLIAYHLVPGSIMTPYHRYQVRQAFSSGADQVNWTLSGNNATLANNLRQQIGHAQAALVVATAPPPQPQPTPSTNLFQNNSIAPSSTTHSAHVPGFVTAASSVTQAAPVPAYAIAALSSTQNTHLTTLFHPASSTQATHVPTFATATSYATQATHIPTFTASATNLIHQTQLVPSNLTQVHSIRVSVGTSPSLPTSAPIPLPHRTISNASTSNSSSSGEDNDDSSSVVSTASIPLLGTFTPAPPSPLTLRYSPYPKSRPLSRKRRHGSAPPLSNPTPPFGSALGVIFEEDTENKP